MASDRDRLNALVEGEHAWPGRGSGEPAHLLDASLLADQLVNALDRIERLEDLIREHKMGPARNMAQALEDDDYARADERRAVDP